MLAAWSSFIGGGDDDTPKTMKILRDTVYENRRCFNCQEWCPIFVCVDFKTFVCQQCSVAHREFGHKTRKVEDIPDCWTAAEVAQMEEEGGNAEAARDWLAGWNEEFFARPLPTDADRIKEFIRKAYIVKCWKRQPTEAEMRELVRAAATASNDTAVAKELTGTSADTAVRSRSDDDEAPEETRRAIDCQDAPPAPARAPAPPAAQSRKPAGVSDRTTDSKPATRSHEPQFCPAHDSSLRRQKQDSSQKVCTGCQQCFETVYAQFSFCVACSNQRSACLVCGAAVQQRRGSCTSLASTSVGDADSCSDGGSESTPNTVPPLAAPVSFSGDLLDIEVPLAAQPAQAPVAEQGVGELDGIFMTDQLLAPTVPVASSSAPVTEDLFADAVFSRAPQPAVSPAIDSFSAQNAATASQVPQDPFAAIKGLYAAEPESKPTSNINALFQPAYAPGTMNATNLSAMDARQLVQLQAMVAESLQRQQRLDAMPVATPQPSALTSVPLATKPGVVGLPPVPQKESSVFDEPLSTDDHKRDPQFGDLLATMQAKAVGWEKSNARCTDMISLI